VCCATLACARTARAGDDAEGRAPAAERAEVAVDAEAPDFTLKDHEGLPFKLSESRTKRHVLLAFFPRAFTPGCTREMKCLGKAREGLEAKNVEVIGVSGDAVGTQARFVTALGLHFKLLSDPDYAVAKRYGVHVQTAEGGFSARSVFLIGSDGRVRYIEREFGVPTTLEGSALEKAIDALGGAEPDRVAALAALPEAEREGKTVLVRYVQAVLSEDVRALDALLHAACGMRRGETDDKRAALRKAWLQRHRDLFAAENIKNVVKFDAVLDLSSARVRTGKEASKAAASTETSDHRRLDTLLEEGDILVVAPTRAPPEGQKRILPAELILVARKTPDGYRLLEQATR
jgi:peroxiredoxin Q/BCP